MSENAVTCNCEECYFKMGVFDNLDDEEVSAVCNEKKELELYKVYVII